MKGKTVLLLLFLTLLSACDSNRIYSRFDGNFPENRWKSSDKKTYDFTITDETQEYDALLKFSHVYDYQFARVPIDIQTTYPSGEQKTSTIDLMLKDSSGNEVGDCGGDLCDLSIKILQQEKLAKGKYTIVISNSFEGPYLPNVLGVGLEVRISE